jgi:hypothetical protein
LGTISELEGFVEAKTKRVPKSYTGIEVKNITTKEYGLSAFIRTFCSDITEPLKTFFQLQWEWILVALYCRLLHTSPLKKMGYNYRKSFLSEELFDGNIKDVTMISTAIEESGYNDAIIIADKGFYSENNLRLLEEANLRYIIPLRRNSSLIDYKRYESLTHSKNLFLFEGRVIYFDSYPVENHISTFRQARMRRFARMTAVRFIFLLTNR